MARYTGPKCKLCRREGVKLFLKGTRCETKKCGIEKRAYPPGQRSWKRRRKFSEYGLQLREKQKAKRYYGILERQFKRMFSEADRQKGNTGENLLVLLERRLDNVVVLLGWALSRAQARQVIAHGHITVNGRRMDVPSYLVEKGDVIAPKDRETSKRLVSDHREEVGTSQKTPPWFEVGDLAARVLQFPSREDVTLDVQEQLIVELCSK